MARSGSAIQSYRAAPRRRRLQQLQRSARCGHRKSAMAWSPLDQNLGPCADVKETAPSAGYLLRPPNRTPDGGGAGSNRVPTRESFRNSLNLGAVGTDKHLLGILRAQFWPSAADRSYSAQAALCVFGCHNSSAASRRRPHNSGSGHELKRPANQRDFVAKETAPAWGYLLRGGAYRPFLHDRHFSAASSFQIGVLCGRHQAVCWPAFWSHRDDDR